MKKNNLYSWLLLGVFCCACNNYLDEIPQNKLKPTTIDDYEQLLNRGYISKQIMPYIDILSDDATLVPEYSSTLSNSRAADIYASAFMWSSSHETSMPEGDQAFGTFYNSAYYANIVLENIDNAVGIEADESKTEELRGSLKGEAYVLRAYSYFNLVNLYAPAYDPATCTTAPGIPINLTPDVERKAYTRSSVEKVYALIESDLKEGIRLMEKYTVEKGTKIRFNALSARALLARVYLYMQQWDLAIEQANAVLKENSSLFDLNAAYQQDPDINNSGTISVYYGEDDLPGKDYLSIDNANVLFVSGITENIMAFAVRDYMTAFAVNGDLYNLYEPGDIRQNYFMRRTSAFNLDAGGRIYKYIFTKNRYIDYPIGNFTFEINSSTGYSRVIRTEEMYLILAEAYAHKTDGLGKAIAALNTLRQSKFVADDYNDLKEEDFTSATILEKVWLERRLELCFEGHRWFDLRRTTRSAITRRGYGSEEVSLAQDDPRYVLQIPKRELDVNPEIGINPR